MNNSIAVSIIVPVYNSEKYLTNCINSILQQTFEDFELLLIDDGSLDNSGAICDRFAKTDKRVKVFHKTNGGICSARNIGLENAKGDYICFCDNDDEYDKDLLKDNYALAIENQADLVRFSRVMLFENNGVITKTVHAISYENQVFHDDEVIKHYDLVRNISGAIWVGMYSNRIVKENNIRFDESIKFGGEDFLFNIEFYRYVKTLVLNNKEYYKWTQRDVHSTSRKFSENSLYANQKCMDEDYQLIKLMNMDKVNPGGWEDILVNYYVVGRYVSLVNDQCPYTKKEKIKDLNEFRKDKVFSDVKKEALKELRRRNLKRYLIYKLFLHRCHRVNMLIVKKYLSYSGRT